MRTMSAVELTAVLFAGLAAIAASVQAYFSYETRDEMARATIYAQRIDACAELLASMGYLRDGANEARRARLAAAGDSPRAQEDFFLFEYFSVFMDADTKNTFLQSYRDAGNRFLVTMPEPMPARLDFFDPVVDRLANPSATMPRAEFIAWLGEIDAQIDGLVTDCRQLI